MKQRWWPGYWPDGFWPDGFFPDEEDASGVVTGTLFGEVPAFTASVSGTVQALQDGGGAWWMAWGSWENWWDWFGGDAARRKKKAEEEATQQAQEAARQIQDDQAGAALEHIQRGLAPVPVPQAAPAPFVPQPHPPLIIRDMTPAPVVGEARVRLPGMQAQAQGLLVPEGKLTAILPTLVCVVGGQWEPMSSPDIQKMVRVMDAWLPRHAIISATLPLFQAKVVGRYDCCTDEEFLDLVNRFLSSRRAA